MRRKCDFYLEPNSILRGDFNMNSENPAAELITSGSQVTVSWLDTVLRRVGAISAGAVRNFNVLDSGPATNSVSVRLEVHYEPESMGELPQKLFLKICDKPEFGSSEIEYYQRDYLDMADAPLPRCYHTGYAEGCYHLLLGDVSDTHEPSWKRGASKDLAIGLAQSLATLHAHRWGSSRLSEVGYQVPDRDVFSKYFGHLEQGIAPMAAELAAGPEQKWLTWLSALLPKLPDLYLRRTDKGADIAVLHGDTNPGNVLAPYGEGQVLLIDRQPFEWSLVCWLGVSDIAHALVVRREISERREMEHEVLKAYHQALVDQGVNGYSFERLYEDYRFCLVEHLLAAVSWCIEAEERERMKWLWTEQLKRAIAALEDHDAIGIWN